MSTTYEIIQAPPKQIKQAKKKNKKTPFLLHAVRFGFQTLGPIFPKWSAKVAYRLFSTPNMKARHKRSDTIIEKAKVFDFMYAGHLLKGYEWGAGDRVVLLVHGWESRGTALRSFVPDLVAKGFRVVAFDGPAHGNSYGKQTNLLHFGGAIRAIINYLGEVESIIAHSFGGASTVFTLSKLDNSIAVDKLVLIAVPAQLDKVIEGFAKYVSLPKGTHEEFVKILEGKVNMSLKDVDVSESKRQMKVGKTLLVHDRDDNIVPFSRSQLIAEKWDNTAFLVTEGYGHYQLVKNPVVINNIVSFLAEKKPEAEF